MERGGMGRGGLMKETLLNSERREGRRGRGGGRGGEGGRVGGRGGGEEAERGSFFIEVSGVIPQVGVWGGKGEGGGEGGVVQRERRVLVEGRGEGGGEDPTPLNYSVLRGGVGGEGGSFFVEVPGMMPQMGVWAGEEGGGLVKGGVVQGRVVEREGGGEGKDPTSLSNSILRGGVGGEGGSFFVEVPGMMPQMGVWMGKGEGGGEGGVVQGERRVLVEGRGEGGGEDPTPLYYSVLRRRGEGSFFVEVSGAIPQMGVWMGGREGGVVQGRVVQGERVLERIMEGERERKGEGGGEGERGGEDPTPLNYTILRGGERGEGRSFFVETPGAIAQYGAMVGGEGEGRGVGGLGKKVVREEEGGEDMFEVIMEESSTGFQWHFEPG